MAKIVLASMYKNEAKNIIRMLESTYKYVNYYIFQNNGSTDDTDNLIKEFLNNKKVPFYIYNVKEGWISFGWNRNHLIQTVLNHDHKCDWILSMDCDEELAVDDNFDWSLLDDTNIDSFHVVAELNQSLYYRCRIYNAKLPWKFKDDKAHELIYIDDPNIGENFQRVDLPKSLRQIGHPTGESYSLPTKYLTDALLFEERLNRENTLLEDLYHFWYIGKSYHDAMFNSSLPLKESQQLEYARRSTYYFIEFINYTHKNYFETYKPDRIDEMAYYAMYSIGLNYNFCKDYENAEKHLILAEEFAPPRNEHLVTLTNIHIEHKEYEKALNIINRLVDIKRINPFPKYHFIIDKNCYIDTSDYIKNLQNKVLELMNPGNILINVLPKKRLFVVDNFYKNPFKIREYALGVEYSDDIRFYKGMRSNQQHIFKGTREVFEQIMGEKIVRFEEHGMCGRFQICTAEDPLVYHYDGQKWAAMVYLSPDAPVDCGTSLLMHKQTGVREANDPNSDSAFTGGFYDKTKFEVVDVVGSIFNRLVIFDSRCIHAACQYFGNSKETGRLTHLFFFD